MKPTLLLLMIAALCSCNAFTDVEVLGPSDPSDPPPNNVSPNISTNNVVENNISLNNISTNNVVANNILPNGGECLENADCNTCTGRYQYVTCDDETCPMDRDEGVCGLGEVCAGADCVSCEMCEAGVNGCIAGNAELCVRLQNDCTTPMSYPCGTPGCRGQGTDTSCNYPGNQCTAPLEKRCNNQFEVVQCVEVRTNEYEWEVVARCDGDEVCEPEINDCAFLLN